MIVPLGVSALWHILKPPCVECGFGHRMNDRMKYTKGLRIKWHRLERWLRG